MGVHFREQCTTLSGPLLSLTNSETIRSERDVVNRNVSLERRSRHARNDHLEVRGRAQGHDSPDPAVALAITLGPDALHGAARGRSGVDGQGADVVAIHVIKETHIARPAAPEHPARQVSFVAALSWGGGFNVHVVAWRIITLIISITTFPRI